MERLEAKLRAEGYEVRRDKHSTRPGDWISKFMEDIGVAERVCVVISPKYLESLYCMRELLSIYQRSLGRKDDFLARVVPLVVGEVKISKTLDRLKHVKHWETQRDELDAALKEIDHANWGNAGRELTLINDFCHRTEEMLGHLQDCIMPRKLEHIEKDDFKAVLEVLSRKNGKTEPPSL